MAKYGDKEVKTGKKHTFTQPQWKPQERGIWFTPVIQKIKTKTRRKV